MSMRGIGVEGAYSVSQRRVLLTKWVGQAWEDMHAEDSDVGF
jgi:hypothetical protein